MTVAAALTCLVFAAGAGMSQAAAQVLLATPVPEIVQAYAAPQRLPQPILRLRFTERIDARQSAMWLIGPTGDRTRLPTVRGPQPTMLQGFTGPLGAGDYRLVWLVSDMAGLLTTGEVFWMIAGP